jgi:hypothetical protein
VVTEMKNNRLTNSEVIQLQEIAERINVLASLENASFAMDKEKDAEIKEYIKPYMIWFKSEASELNKILKTNN